MSAGQQESRRGARRAGNSNNLGAETVMGLKTNKPPASSPTPSTPPELTLEVTWKPSESDALSKARAAFDPPFGPS